MEALWSRAVGSVSPGIVELVGTSLVQILSFWVPSLVYLTLDSVAPKFANKYKIQPAPKQPSKAEIWHCAEVVVGNQALTAIIKVAELSALYALGIGSFYRVDKQLPSLAEIIRDFTLCVLGAEIIFYYGHRLLHHPRFYSRIHKKHHQFTAPIAPTAQYSHPLEHILSNVIPLALPPQILQCHIITFWLFLGCALFETVTVHSGFDFFSGCVRMHDLHHEKFSINYGSLGFLDLAHGTFAMNIKPKKKLAGQSP
ncbi:hypothetical protein M8818_002267 [Zalaria obscura]|uniref:Uncharacterized protein n=1 Tax=Zalaria obscura TaxID=2024903 RepID=A0ACC3SKD0_9PEZI